MLVYGCQSEAWGFFNNFILNFFLEPKKSFCVGDMKAQ